MPSSDDATDALVALALNELGAVVVIDRALRVRASAPGAARVLGAPVPAGASLAELLGEAGALTVRAGVSTGRPFQCALLVPHASSAGPPAGDAEGPQAEEGQLPGIVVRGTPLGASAAGWMLVLHATTSGDARPELFHGMWTQDPATREVFRIIERVAIEDVTVLVRGETGSGKELVAHALHALSARSAGPLRALNCAALPPSLLESELFGHVRGAFTGAVRDAPGHMQLAHRGTLFLDEVAELPLELQAKLLRVIETRTVLPVGAREPVPVDVRIVSATHRALRKEVEAGRFRADLMFRLRVIPIFLPALRERRGDVPLLLQKLIAQQNENGRRRIDAIAPAALAALDAYDYPGNIRELRNILAYAYAIGAGTTLQRSDLPAEVHAAVRASSSPPSSSPSSSPSASSSAGSAAAEVEPADVEAARIRAALATAGGSRARAAELLQMSRVTLWRRMRELGLATARRRRAPRVAPHS